MNFSTQPISLAALPSSIEAKGFSPSDFQQAVALQPLLASQAAAQTSRLPSPALLSSHVNLNPLKGTAAHSDAQLQKVSKDFETIFMRMLFKEMRNTVQKSNVLGNSSSLEFFETLRDDQLSEQLASSGGIGIGRMIYQKLKAATVPHLKTFS